MNQILCVTKITGFVPLSDEHIMEMFWEGGQEIVF